jgi:hypothetical protein
MSLNDNLGEWFAAPPFFIQLNSGAKVPDHASLRSVAARQAQNGLGRSVPRRSSSLAPVVGS